MRSLQLRRTECGSFSCPVPADIRNRWCVLLLASAGQRRDMPARVRLRMEGDPASGFETYVPAPHGLTAIAGRVAVIYIAGAAASLHVDLFGVGASVQSVVLRVLPVSRTAAAALFALRHPVRLLRALRGGGLGFVRRLRTALALLAGTPSGRRSYPLWIELFDSWGRDATGEVAVHSAPAIGVAVLQPGEQESALDATLGSLAAQGGPVVPIIVTGTGKPAWQTLARALSEHDAAYVAVLQAGEVLRPLALAAIGEAVAGPDGPDAIFADEDRLDAAGQRRDPLFKPEANHALMLSGTLTRGVWVFRRADLLALLDPGHAPPGELWAETLRLQAWLALYERPAIPRTHRLPFVLTHRRPDTQPAPEAELAGVVRRHLGRTGLPGAIASETFPLQVRFTAPQASQPPVSLIVPTAARSPHVTDCLSAVLAQTDYTSFEMVLVVSQTGPLEERQARILEPILRDPRVRLVLLPTPSFNFSQANNAGARHATGDLLCLLNDDVAPMRPDWLAGMAGHLADPRIGAVGAKLYYANRTIQHAGVLIGLAGLAAHANRMLAQGEPGYACRAVLNQELSAVTGACLLVRRSVYEALGGLDEAYPIAFNDVDFCLRIREAGHGIVFSAQTEMWHYESVSLGHHFSGERAAQEASELLRMRSRWAEICRNDPFHNPNLSQERGAEWELAFPPRAQPLRSRYSLSQLLNQENPETCCQLPSSLPIGPSSSPAPAAPSRNGWRCWMKPAPRMSVSSRPTPTRPSARPLAHGCASDCQPRRKSAPPGWYCWPASRNRTRSAWPRRLAGTVSC